MRSLLFTFLSFLFLTATAQQNVTLRLDHMVGDEAFELNTEYSEPDQGYNFSITRLQYYISQIEITHDGGQKTLLTDTWLLVDAAEQSDFDLGSHNINSVEAINYWVGVEKDYNHLDPSQYPSGHPLAPQNPAMHWGWAAGYRFACLEGQTGFNLLITYQIHALGDINYHAVSLETGAFMEGDNLVIPILADYMGLYKDIDVSTGLIEHSEFNEAAELLSNFSTEVYSPMYFTSIEDEIFEGSFLVGPNPSTVENARLMLNLPESKEYNVSVFDISGKVIQSFDLSNGNYTLPLDATMPGIYFVRLSQNGQAMTTKKLVITN